jgi:hypothetical protein
MRRLFRRQIRKRLAADIPPILQEANFVFDKGEYGRAAELFEQIAQTADARGGPRAPLFHLQAGRARILVGQTALGMPSLKRGLELLAQRRQFSRLYKAGMRVLAELNERGLRTESAEIETWLKTVLPSMPAMIGPDATSKTPVLPTHCSAAAQGYDQMKSNGWMKSRLSARIVEALLEQRIDRNVAAILYRCSFCAHLSPHHNLQIKHAHHTD